MHIMVQSRLLDVLQLLAQSNSQAVSHSALYLLGDGLEDSIARSNSHDLSSQFFRTTWKEENVS